MHIMRNNDSTATGNNKPDTYRKYCYENYSSDKSLIFHLRNHSSCVYLIEQS